MGKPKKTTIKTLNTNNNLSLRPTSLPREIQPNVLTVLPVKSLLQFRSVSKTWQSIIDSPTFAYTHYSRAETRSGGAKILLSFSNSDRSKHYLYSVGLLGGRATHHLTLPGDGTANGCCFLPPVKGLVCFLNSKKIYVCNPSTRKVRVIPHCPTIYKKTSLNNSYLYKLYSCYSFGFDSFSRVYKILHVFGLLCRNDNKLYNVESRVLTIKTPDQFSLDSFSWKKIDSSFPYPYPFKSQGVFVDDCICWVGMKSPGEGNIVAFDFRHEKFRLIPSPPNGVSPKSKLENIEGNLGIMSFKDYDDFCLELWVYQNSTWVKKDIGSQVALKRKGKNTDFPSFVGNFYTGGKLLTQDVLLHNFVLRSLNGGSRERGVRITGLPGWVDFLDYKKVNFNTFGFVESVMPLDFLIRLGDFVMDLAAVQHPKLPLLMKLMPHEEVKVKDYKIAKEWKIEELVFGDLELFQSKNKLASVVEEEKKSAKSKPNGKWLKKVKSTGSKERLERK